MVVMALSLPVAAAATDGEISDEVGTVARNEALNSLRHLGRKFSFFPKPKSKWPDSEQSVGRFCGMQKRYSYWEAKGKAQEAFNVLSPKIADLLERSCGPVPSSSQIIYDIFMVGETPHTAIPHIMFSCRKSEPRKAAMETLKKSGLLSNYSGIKTGHWQFPPHIMDPQPLASEEDFDMDTEVVDSKVLLVPSYESFSTTLPTLLSTTISATRLYKFDTPGSPNASLKATVGSLVRFAGKPFYFSVSHAFSEDADKDPESVFDNADDEDDSAFEFGGFDDGEDAIDEEMDITGSGSMDEEVNITGSGSMTSESSGFPDDFNEDFKESPGSSDRAASKDTAKLLSEMAESWSKESLKHKVQAPFQSQLKIGETENSDMNYAAVYLLSTNLDYALIELDREHNLTPASEQLPNISLENARKIPSGETDIMTVTGSSGLLFGVLSGRPSYVRLISATTFQEAFTVTIKGPLMPGDSGSIVLNSKTGEVYGHMIVGSTASRIAYIIPAINVLKDLKLREEHTQETSEVEAPTFQIEHNDEETAPRESEFPPDSKTLPAVTAPVVYQAEKSKMDTEDDSSDVQVLETTNFEYKPISLKGPGFRLLRLLKGNNGPIQCQLFESELSIPEHTTASPEQIYSYEALSYTWANASRSCNIIVNGSNMTVTMNTYLALQSLRYEEEDRVLWIDTICINQNDKEEESQQIQQLGSIYSRAERVIIWLGEYTYDTDFVMHHMKHLENRGFKDISNCQEILDKQWANTGSLVVRDLTLKQRDVFVESLNSLLHRSWFERVWIIQEIANAQVAETPDGGKSVSAEFHNSEATDPGDKIHVVLGVSSIAYDASLRADYKGTLEDITFVTNLLLINLNELAPPIRRFFESTLLGFLQDLVVLPNKANKYVQNTSSRPVLEPWLKIGNAEVNSRDYDSEMLLLWAAQSGHEAVVKLLLERGAHLETMDKSNRTPLSLAARNGYEAVVKLLLERGAHLETMDEWNQTPLLLAAQHGHEAVVKLLLDRGADIEFKGGWNGTPLLQAATNGHEAVVKLLLERGAYIETMDKSNRTPLSLAAEHGHEAVVKLLLERDTYLETMNKWNQTPLLLAVQHGHEAVVKLLLDRGADIESNSGWNGTPLLQAATNGHKAVVKLLLDRGADIEFKGGWNGIPLSQAAKNGHEAVVRLLVEGGTDIEAKDRLGYTPLSLAAKYGHEAVVKLLLERGAHLETKDKLYDRTPLLWAAECGHEAVVRLLVEGGADIGAKDKRDYTPLLWATEIGHKAVVKLLLEARDDGVVGR
ncbi:Ankyrin repeat protein [Rutstroemia sp. NJR-2017a BVV2]|nr:Ankyrin repeat protein [Rutstroemia sp. NJR-2017a BVV2]